MPPMTASVTQIVPTAPNSARTQPRTLELSPAVIVDAPAVACTVSMPFGPDATADWPVQPMMRTPEAWSRLVCSCRNQRRFGRAGEIRKEMDGVAVVAVKQLEPLAGSAVRPDV